MTQILLLIMMARVVFMQEEEALPTAQQLIDYREKSNGSSIMTTSAGTPIEYTDATCTLNRPLLNNEYFRDTMTHFVREEITPRIVHAKGAGAYGYFEVTHDITDLCKAKLFSEVGKITPIVVRFSTAFISKGGSDIGRDARGFSVKFYTEEGNLDLAGLSVPVFPVIDPIHFPHIVRATKKNPATNLADVNMTWDFLTFFPDSMFLNLFTFGDMGIPDGYINMPGYSIHTYELVNHKGVKSFVRFHFVPDAGVKTLTTEEAIIISDIDYATRGLYNAIGKKKFPSWTVKIQVLSLEDVKMAGFDVFDVTKLLPEDKYPLQCLGKFVLNRNPVNYFAEIEQLAFCPCNLVPGVESSR